MDEKEARCPFHAHAIAVSAMCRRTFQRPRADGTMPRTFHDKTHACLAGEFHVEPAERAEYRHGVFAEKRMFRAEGRFSNSFFADDGHPDARGLAIKLTGVPGEVFEGAPPGQQDFLLVNHPTSPTGDAADTREFFSTLDGLKKITPARLFAFRYAMPSWNPFRARWRYFRLVLETCRRHAQGRDLAAMSYYSVTPFRLGEGAVKFVVRPGLDTAGGGRTTCRDFRDRLRAALERGSLTFDFFIQPKLGESESLECADVAWETPLVKVGRLVFPPQDVGATIARGDRLAFSPWNCLRAHEPLGSINALRRLAYRESAEARGGDARFTA